MRVNKYGRRYLCGWWKVLTSVVSFKAYNEEQMIKKKTLRVVGDNLPEKTDPWIGDKQWPSKDHSQERRSWARKKTVSKRNHFLKYTKKKAIL